MYDIYMKFTITELRNNIRKILDYADKGEEIVIQRYDKYYKLMVKESQESINETKQSNSLGTNKLTPRNEIKLPENNLEVARPFIKSTKSETTTDLEHPPGGKECCYKKKRCDHWQWDESSLIYINTLTGEQLEPVIEG